MDKFGLLQGKFEIGDDGTIEMTAVESNNPAWWKQLKLWGRDDQSKSIKQKGVS